MVRLSTTYDKDLNKKVFMVRGDEAYARTTDCKVNITGTITTENVQGLLISELKINLYRTLGDGMVTLYDDEQLLNAWTFSEETTEITVTNLYLSYGVNHELYAVYKPLHDYCFGSKSKRLNVFEPIPDEYYGVVLFSANVIQINNSSPTVNVTVKRKNDSTINNASISYYLDDVFIGTTSNNSVSLSNVADGKHILRVELHNGEDYYGTSYTCDLLKGYIVEIVDYPKCSVVLDSRLIRKMPSLFTTRGKVTDYNDNPVSQIPVTFINEGYTITYNTDQDGIVEFDDIMDYYETGSARLSCYGSLSDEVQINVPSINNVELSCNSIFFEDEENIITANVTGEGSLNNIPICIVDDSDTDYYWIGYTDSNGIASIKYNGVGAGFRNVSNDFGYNLLSFVDVHQYWTPNKLVNQDYDKIDGELIQLNNYFQLFKIKGSALLGFNMIVTVIWLVR